MNLLNEINEKLKHSQYVKAFKLISKYDYKDSNEISIKILRRYSYCSNKLLYKYLAQYEKKSHKVKPMLYRSFDALIKWGIYLQKEETRSFVFNPRRMTIMSPKPMIDRIQQKLKKEDQWLAKQKKMFLKSLMKALDYFYTYLKLKKDSVGFLVLKKLLLLSYFNDQHYKLKKSSIIDRQMLLSLIGNAYFELHSMQKCVDHMIVSITMGVEKLIFPLLHAKEMQILKFDDKKFKNKLIEVTQLTIMQLDILAMAQEQMSKPHQALNSLNFAQLLSSILSYYRQEEMPNYIEFRFEQIQEKYFDSIQEDKELLKFTKLLWEYKDKELTYHKHQSLHQELINKFKIHTLQPPLVVKTYEQTSYSVEPAPIVHQKKSSDITETTIYSARHSKTNSEIQFHQESNGLPSISILQPQDIVKNFKKFPKKEHMVKKSANNYLAKLLQMQSPQKQQIAEEIPQHTQKRQFKTLDQEINQQIYRKLQMKKNSFEEANQNCRNLIVEEKELKKEFPFNYEMLQFKRDFGSGLAVLRESVSEFNVHFEFNVLMYFDYLTSNRNSAMQSIKENHHFQSLRLAEQKLLQSKNLVLKKQFQPYLQEKKESEKQQQDNEQFAFKLLNTVQSHVQLKQSQFKINLEDLEKPKPIRSLYNTPRKNLEELLNNFKIAQQSIKTQLVSREETEEEPIENQSQKQSCRFLGRSELSKSVKQFSTKNYAKVLRSTFNNLIKFKQV